MLYIEQRAASVVYFNKLLMHKYIVKTFQTCLYDCIASNDYATVYTEYIPAWLTGGFVEAGIVVLAPTNHYMKQNYNYVLFAVNNKVDIIMFVLLKTKQLNGSKFALDDVLQKFAVFG